MKYLFFLCFFLLGAQGAAAQTLLTDVDKLWFKAGKMTTGRRGPSVPQLQCSGGYCYSQSVNSAWCLNKGNSPPIWECDGDMRSGYKFETAEVSCEGYSYAGDPRALDGSCSLQYSLGRDREQLFYQEIKKDGVGEYLVLLAVVLVVLLLIIWFCWPEPPRTVPYATAVPPPPNYWYTPTYRRPVSPPAYRPPRRSVSPTPKTVYAQTVERTNQPKTKTEHVYAPTVDRTASSSSSNVAKTVDRTAGKSNWSTVGNVASSVIPKSSSKTYATTTSR